MSDEIVSYNGARNRVVATLPHVLPTGLVHAALLSAVARTAEAAVQTVATAHYAVVKVLRDNRIAIQLLDYERRVFKEDVLPILAINRAHQAGRRALGGAGLDSDLLESALEDLERKRQQRRDRL
jgi:hypothetical protein